MWPEAVGSARKPYPLDIWWKQAAAHGEAISAEAKKTLAKRLEKTVNEMQTMGTEKVQHVLKALEGHMHVQGNMHTQDRPERILISYLWVWFGTKQEVVAYR